MSYRILVLNDNDNEVSQLQDAAKSGNFTIKRIGSIGEAMHWLNTRDHIDLIVSAVHLENESVFDFLKAVKTDRRHDWVQFIMLLSEPTQLAELVNEQVRTAARMLGADKYLMMDRYDPYRLMQEIRASLPAEPPQSEQDPDREEAGHPRPIADMERGHARYNPDHKNFGQTPSREEP